MVTPAIISAAIRNRSVVDRRTVVMVVVSMVIADGIAKQSRRSDTGDG
jgi:hypothetical protein